ncbi:acyltransferase family protein, partial [Oscillibacter sp. CAG:155]
MMRVKEVDPSLRRAAPGRDRAVDLVKTAAIFGVLLIHVSAGGLGGAEVGSGTWFACLFWGSVSRAAVPLFLMASGALLLRPDRELTLRKLYTKNFPRLLAALLFWAVCYKVFNLLLWG